MFLKNPVSKCYLSLTDFDETTEIHVDNSNDQEGGGNNNDDARSQSVDRHHPARVQAWAGIVILSLAAIHIPLHWAWIVNMTVRAFKLIIGNYKMNLYAKFNLGVNIFIGASALISGLSGIYFLLVPGASHESMAPDPLWLFSRMTWDLIHTWSGVLLIAAATLHIYIHWKWAFKITRKYWRALRRSLTRHTDQRPSVLG